MVDPLSRLAITYGTDKFGYHDYPPNYYHLFKHLKDKPIRLMEIGVGGYQDADRGGESLEVWRDFFPNGRIVGIDIQKKEMDLGERVTILQGSQVDPDFLAEVVREHGPFDIIIDDGSHQNEHVVTSFELLFGGLAEGGIYVAEDVQTAFFPRFGGSLEMSAPNSVGYFGEMAAMLDDGADWIPEDVAGIERFHNMIALHKGRPAWVERPVGFLAGREDEALKIIVLGEKGAKAEWEAYSAKFQVREVNVSAKGLSGKALETLLKEAPFDVIVDAADLGAKTRVALFGALAMGGHYVVLGGDIADLGREFADVDHCEIAVNFPQHEANPLAKDVLALMRARGVVAYVKGANDYPSNFGFDYEHPLALAAFGEMEEVLLEDGKERGLLLFTDIMTRAGREDVVVKLLKRLGEMGATTRPYYNMAVRQAKLDQEWDEAKVLLANAVKLYPEDGRIRSQLGTVLVKERDWDGAKAAFEKAIEIMPRDPLARIQLANVLSRLEEHDAAVEAARSAIELAPKHAGHRVQLGRLEVNAGEHEAAVETLQAAVELNAEVPHAHRQMSRALHALGRMAEARDMADKAVALRPENAEHLRWQERLAGEVEAPLAIG